jgi:WD40 repeat protein
VQLLDIDQRREVLTVPRAGEAALMHLVPLAFAPDGTGVLTADGATLTARTLPGGAARPPVPVDIGGPIRAILGWSPGRGLAALFTSRGPGRDGRVVVVRLDTGRAVHTVPVESDPHARLTPDGRHLVVAEREGVRVWDTATWAVVGQTTLPQVRFADLDLSPDGRLAVVTAFDGQLRLLTLGAGVGGVPPAGTPDPGTMPAARPEFKPVWDVAFDVDPGRMPRSVRYSADGSRLVAPAFQAAVTHTFDAATGKSLATLADTVGSVVTAFPAGGGSAITYAANAPAAKVWSTDTGRELDTIPVPHDGRCQLLDLSPDGRTALLRRNADNEIAVLDMRTGKAVALTPVQGLGAATLSPDGTAALVTAGNRAMVFATSDGRRTTQFDLPFARCRDAALAPDRRTAVLLPAPAPDAPEPPLHVIDVSQGRSVRTLPGPFARAAGTVRFTRDGRLLGTARRPDPTGGWAFEVYDTATWQSVARAAEPVAPIGVFDFAPDGRRAVVWSADGRLRAYDLPVSGPLAPRAELAARPARNPVPDRDAVAKADAVIRESYKADFARKLPADRRRLAEKLLREADQTADPAARFALLRTAEAVAAELADVPLAAQAIDGLDRDFDIDGPAEKAKLVEKVSAGTTQVAQLRAAAEAALEMADEAVERDDFDRAVAFAGLAVAALTKAGQTTPLKEAEARQQQLAKLRDEFEPVRRAAAALKANPADPAAALAVGKYRALVQRRWEDGLPLLAAGADPALRKLAELDLRAATDTATTDVQRGDAWAEYAKTQPEAARDPYLSRAKYWYVRALSAQRGGLEVEAAKAKLAFPIAGREHRPGLIAEFLAGPDLKERKKVQIDLTVDVVTRDHRDLGPGMRVLWSGVLIPPATGRYRLIADTPGAVEVWLHAKTGLNVVLSSRPGKFKEATVPLTGDKPVPIWVEYAVLPERGRLPQQTFALKWQRPGAKAPEVIPPGAFFHPRKEAEKLLAGEK